MHFSRAVLFILLCLSPGRSLPAEGTADKNREQTPGKDPSETWIRDEVSYIVSDGERKLFQSLKTPRQREEFIRLFWLHRDPTPGTEKNEFYDEYMSRVEYANSHFGRTTSLPGWKTDRGRAYILLGKPKEVQNFYGNSYVRDTELWFYQSYEPSLPAFFYLIFYRESDSGDLELYQPGPQGPEKLIRLQMGAKEEGDRGAALQTLDDLRTELARASISLVPSDEADVDSARPSLGSTLLLAKIDNLKNDKVSMEDLADLKARTGDIETEYTLGSYPLQCAIAEFAQPGGYSHLHYALEVPANSISMGQFNDKFTTAFEIVGQILDVKGRIARSIYETVEVELTAEQFEQVKTFPFGFEDRVALLPGAYKMHLIVKNDPKKEVGIMDASFSIPEPGRKSLRILGLTAGYLVPGKASKAVESDVVEPFQFAGQKVYPAIGGKYGKSDTIRVTYEVVLPEGKGAGDLTGDYRIFAGDSELLKEPLAAADITDRGEGILLVSRSLRVPGMPTGEYRLDVSAAVPSAKITVSGSRTIQVEASVAVPRPWIKAKSYTNSASDRYQLGLQYILREDLDRAEAQFKEALAIEPDLTWVKLKLASLYLKKKNFEGVIKICSPILFQNPSNTEAALNLAVAYSGLQNYKEAVKLYDKVLTGGVETDAILNAMAEACYNAGDVQRAIEVLKRSLALYPEQPHIRSFLARLSAGQG
jgi:GWxTD domain-containing protein